MSLTSRSAISLVKVSLTFIRMTVTESAAGGEKREDLVEPW
jgi:hypothetical protein